MRFRILLAALSVLGFAACGGSGGSANPAPAPAPPAPPPPPPPPPPVTFTVGGIASGLNGTAVLRNNGGDNLTISANGAFTFATAVTSGGAYAVTVLTQPATQTCAVTSGTGTVTANVTQVALACADNAPPAPAVPLVDDTRTASGVVGIGGGTVSVTSARGIIYSLEVPAGALNTAVEIRMAPVVNMGGAPLAAGLLGAVRFEPAGLKFLKAARLTISPLPLGSTRPLLAGFNTANDGGNFNLNAVQRIGTSVIVDVAHFSIAGASEATEAEFAEIPLEPLGPTFTADAARSAAFELLIAGRGENQEQISEVMLRWYETLVRPAIDSAVSIDSDSQERALAIYMDWRQTIDRLVDYGLDAARLNSRLTTAFAHAGEHMPDVLLMYVDLQLDTCFEDESIAHLSMASLMQQLATSLGFAPPGSPLDRASFRARVNDCLRVVLDPITLPSPLTIGQDNSLDARAQVVFNENPNPVGAPFEFTVTPTNSTVATSPGFSNAEGRFTTVFRPTALPVSFIVRACLVGRELSDICVAQTVSTPGGPLELSKRIDNTFNGEHGPSGVVVGSFLIQASSSFQGSTGSYAITRDTVNAIDRGGFIDARARCASTLESRGARASIEFSLVVNLTTPVSVRLRSTPGYAGSNRADSLNAGHGSSSVSIRRPNASSFFNGSGSDSEGGLEPFELFVPLLVGENLINMILSADCTGTGTANFTNTFELVFE